MKGVVNDSHAVAQGAIYKKAKAVSDCKVGRVFPSSY